MKLWMITGSATDDGAPIYLQSTGLQSTGLQSTGLQSAGRWTRKLRAGHPLASEAERDALLAAAREQQRLVCDPYVIEVRRAELGHLAPTSLRETIRAEGPTVTQVGALVGASTPRSATAAASA